MVILMTVESKLETLPPVSEYVRLRLVVFCCEANVIPVGSTEEAFTVSEKISSSISVFVSGAR